MKNVEILWISRFDYLKGWVLKPHEHKDFYQLIYLIEGSCTFTIENTFFEVTAPTYLFISPKRKHGISKVSTNGMKTLDIKFRILQQPLQKYCSRIHPVSCVFDSDVHSRLEAIREEGTEQDILYQLNCQSLLIQILVKMIRFYSPKIQKKTHSIKLIQNEDLSPLVIKTLGFIEHNYQAKITAITIADRMNYSYRYVSKIFEKETGMTPLMYANKYRILQAQKLLSSLNYEIKNVSDILGYYNVQDFTRSFKKIVGIPPGKWKEQASQGIWKDIFINSNFTNTLLIDVNNQ